MKTSKLFKQVKKDFKLNKLYIYETSNGFKFEIIIKEFITEKNFEYIVADCRSDINFIGKKDQKLLINQLEYLYRYKEA